VEIIVILVIALIVIPPDHLPDVMRAVGKILRELRLASHMVVRELSGVIDEPSEPRLPRAANPMADPIRPTGDPVAPAASPAAEPRTSADPTAPR
jgi:Sec-independent protein translocase protein TatA